MMDIGATSYQLVRLATVLEEELGLRVEVEELLRFPSVAVIVSCHLSATAGPPGRLAARAASRPALPPPCRPCPLPGTPLTGLVARQAFKDTHPRHPATTSDDRPAGFPGRRPWPEPVVMRPQAYATFDARPMELGGLASLLASLRVGRLDRRTQSTATRPRGGRLPPSKSTWLAAPGARSGALPRWAPTTTIPSATGSHPARSRGGTARICARPTVKPGRSIVNQAFSPLSDRADDRHHPAVRRPQPGTSRSSKPARSHSSSGRAPRRVRSGPLLGRGRWRPPAALDALFALSDDDSFLHALFRRRAVRPGSGPMNPAHPAPDRGGSAERSPARG